MNSPMNDLRVLLEKAAQELAARVAGGTCRSHDEYRDMTGRIRGIQDAVGMLDEVVKRGDLDEDSDNLDPMVSDIGRRK